MEIYLVMYGADNEMMTFSADDIEHVIEQFKDCGEDGEINHIYRCAELSFHV